MIVFPSGFVLSEVAAGRPLTHPRIGYQTYTFDLDASDVTVSSEAADGPKDAPLRPDTGEAWQPTSLPATWLLDLGTSRDLDYIGVAGHNIGSCAALILIETSTGSFAGSPPAQVWDQFSEDVAPADDAPILFLDDSRIARYIRITISGSGDIPRLAVVYIGEVLAMQRPIYAGHAPITLSRDTVLHQSLSSGGQFLGQGYRRNGVAGAASFRHLTSDWYRANFDPFVKAARRFPFFWGWRPATFPLEVGYVWSPADIRPSNMGIQDFMMVSFDMVGIGHE